MSNLIGTDINDLQIDDMDANMSKEDIEKFANMLKNQLSENDETIQTGGGNDEKDAKIHEQIVKENLDNTLIDDAETIDPNDLNRMNKVTEDISEKINKDIDMIQDNINKLQKPLNNANPRKNMSYTELLLSSSKEPVVVALCYLIISSTQVNSLLKTRLPSLFDESDGKIGLFLKSIIIGVMFFCIKRFV